MRAIEEQIKLQEATLRVALVQFSNPFASRDLIIRRASAESPSRIEWRTNSARDARSARVHEILQRLKESRGQSGNLNLIAFPEYSVPEECHDTLQEYSDQHQCVIVPGSYYSHDGPYARHNICKIYRPADPPVIIAKRHPSDDEKDLLSEETEAPNIAHLVWRAQGTERSISVYLCRDYLCAYSPERISLQDWDRPGINLVVMLSPQTWLFEGQAALDIRRLPQGKGRFVALCNCADAGPAGAYTGTCLLGPREERKATTEDDNVEKRDVIERLPSNIEGILSSELDLRHNVSMVKETPNRRTFSPLVWSNSARIVADNQGRLRLDALPTHQPGKRGVWHPAFLEAINRKIRIQLFRSHRSDHVQELASTGQFRYLSMSALVGEEDFLFRIYEPNGERVSCANIPYFCGDPEDFKASFVNRSPTEFLIEPRQIYKYRTVPLPNLERPIAERNSSWEAAKRTIQQILPDDRSDERRRLIDAACLLARDWNAAQIDRETLEELAPLFLDKQEDVPRIGPQSGNQLRRRYVLVNVPHEGSVEAFRRLICRWLVDQREVRSIYELTHQTGIDGGEVKFHFWLDIIATPYAADAVIAELRRRAVQEDEELLIGTRSMDVMDHLRHESVEGIASTDHWGYDAQTFYQAINADSRLRIYHEHESLRAHHIFVRSVATRWREHGNTIKAIHHATFGDYISDFHKFFLYGNCVASRQDNRRLRVIAKNAWNNAYQETETLCTDLLKTFGPASEQDAKIAAVLKSNNERMTERTKNPLWRFVWLVKRNGGTLKKIQNLTRFEKCVEGLLDVRNRFIHPMSDLSIEDWMFVLSEDEASRTRSRDIGEATNILVQLFVAATAYKPSTPQIDQAYA